MSSRLRDSARVWKLAEDLGLRNITHPVADILQHCERKVRRLLRDADTKPKTLKDLLEWLGGMLGTVFEVIYGEADLARIKMKYVARGEKMFSLLEEELTNEVFGITFKRLTGEHWEPPFVSVIDCRGSKAARAYYTKWHELAHLLVQTDQMRLAFRRTHCDAAKRDPEEALIDVIAGAYAFYSPIVHDHANGQISFEAIEDLRQRICPEASAQASLLGFSRAWPHPCLLILAEMAFNKDEKEQLIQQRLDFAECPTPALRAIRVTANDAAKDLDIVIFENMRVPGSSVIYTVFSTTTDYAEAEEDLTWWETSKGARLHKQRVFVRAKRIGSSVYSLIVPINSVGSAPTL